MLSSFRTCCFALLLTGTLAACREQPKPAPVTLPLDSAQLVIGNPYRGVDQSQMDMEYFPVDFPIVQLNKQDGAKPLARVVYSRPHKHNREVFGTDARAVVKYGSNWRLGANEATEIQLFQPAMINNKQVQAGRYTLYAVPTPTQWTVVLSTKTDNWGLDIDTTKDVVRTTLPVQAQSPPLEDFTMKFSGSGNEGMLLMAWDSAKVEMPIRFGF